MKRRSGVITGYRVQYKERDGLENKWTNKSFNATSSNGTLENLKMFHSYLVRIAGITGKGSGVFSQAIDVWTDEDSK